MSPGQDLRLTLRRLRKNPLFAITVVGTLAIGIAATTSIYTIVDGVLLKPLPFPEPETLVRVTADYEKVNLREVGLSRPELDDLGARSGAFDAIAGIWPITANLTGSDRPERVEVLLASPNYFDLLGAHAALGRTFTPGDTHPGIATVAVISDGLWRRGFGGDSRVIGRKLRIDEDAYEIVGVMPASFRHPSVTLETDVEVWAPAGWASAPFPPPGYSARFIPSAIARLKRGTFVNEAKARVESLAKALSREHAGDYPERLGWIPRVTPLAGDLVAGVRPVLWILMGAIGFVLLIVVTNISNLLLARAAAREREVAVLRALGADRWRIVRSLLIEGLVLAAAGGAAGFLMSLWGVDLLLRLAPDRLPRVADIGVDHRVLAFAIGISTLTGLLAGLAPALQSARTDIIARLRESGRAVHGGRRARLIRSALVVSQVAIAILLLAGAGLLGRSFRNLQQVGTGFSTDLVVMGRLWLPQPNDPQSGPYFTHPARVVLINAIVDRLKATPGLADAGLSTALPVSADSGNANFAVEGWAPDRTDFATATPVSVTPGYFSTIGVRLVRGRLLQHTDDEHAPRAIVVNETLAKAYFAGDDPVGRRVRFIGRRGQVPANAPWLTIVGVAGDAKEDGLDAAVRPQIYQSLLQVSNLGLAIVARGTAAAPSAEAIRRAVESVDPNLPVYAVRTADELVAVGLAQRRFATLLINVFAATALLLAALGLHGVVAYTVRQRTHEIGVRLALGATAGRIVTLVMAQGLRLAGVGIVIGVVAALGLSRFVSTMLFNVSSRDPWTFGGVVALLGLVVVIATLAAARRAATIDAATALRAD